MAAIVALRLWQASLQDNGAMPPASQPHAPGNAGTPTHLIVPFAVCSSEAWLKTVSAMASHSTRHTQALLRGMTRVAADLASDHSLSPPHERALAQALGLPGDDEADGLIPWAAREAARSLTDAHPGQGWAWLTPCHWAMGREHATLSDPAALGLSEPESRTLLAVMAPYFETDGIKLHFLRADRWLAEGEVFCSLPTASLDRVLGRNVDPWLPKDKTLTRLQNEMQMLLYTHAVNDARGVARQWPVNSFWISGSGTLAGLPAPIESETPIHAPRTLAEAAFQNDWAGYAQAWAELDSGFVKDLLTRQREGQTVRLTLCGERGFETWQSTPSSWHRPLSNWLQSLSVSAPQPILAGRKQL
jgi:hypothetical protein